MCNGYNAQALNSWRSPSLESPKGISNGAVDLRSSRKLIVPRLNGYEWGSQLSVSIWFIRDTYSNSYTRIRGLINNGPAVNHSTLGIQIVRSDTSSHAVDCIQASLVTSNSKKTWDKITTAVSNHWHHLVMIYDGKTVKFYHNSLLVLTDSECCHGNIVSRNNDVVIGYTTYKDKHYYRRNRDGYFNGYIDETKLFRKALTAHEVLKLYRLEVV